MSERANSFVEAWVIENVISEGNQPKDDLALARDLAQRCLAAAHAEGISEEEIKEGFEDLVEFLSSEIEAINDREVDRLAEKDN